MTYFVSVPNTAGAGSVRAIRGVYEGTSRWLFPVPLATTGLDQFAQKAECHRNSVCRLRSVNRNSVCRLSVNRNSVQIEEF